MLWSNPDFPYEGEDMTDKRRPVEHDVYANRETLHQPRNKPPRPQRVGSDNDHAARQGRVDPRNGDKVFNENTNQHPANFHDKLYDNDVVRLDSWLRSNDATWTPAAPGSNSTSRARPKLQVILIGGISARQITG